MKNRKIIEDQLMKCESLLPQKELYRMKLDERGLSREYGKLTSYRRRIISQDNLYLLTDNIKLTLANKFPMVKAYTGTTSLEYVSFAKRKKHKVKGSALGFFMNDTDFSHAVWDKLETTTSKIIDYDVVFAPDFSLYAGERYTQQNKSNVYRSRFVAAYWQQCGLNVIPVASWGDANSFSY